MGLTVPPSEWHPRHELDTIEVKLHLPPFSARATDSTTGSVSGRSSTRRGNLWHEASVWGPAERWEDGSDVADWVIAIVRTALRHTPTSQEDLTRHLLGGYETPPMF